MKKVLICGVIAAAFGMSAAFAASEVGDFKVTATVTPTCKVTSSTPVIAFGAIPAFSTSITPKTADLTFKCTVGLTPNTPTLSKTTSVVAGFAYDLEVDGGTLSTAGVATDAANTTAATADQWTFKVKATIQDNQPGDPNAATSDTQTLTINF